MDGDSIALHGVTEESTTADVKRQLLHADKVYAVRLQRLMIQQPYDEFAVRNLIVRRLARLGIQGERVVAVVMRATAFAAARPGVRTFGSFGGNAGQFSRRWGMCVSPNSELIFVSDWCNHRVQVVRRTALMCALSAQRAVTSGHLASCACRPTVSSSVCLSPMTRTTESASSSRRGRARTCARFGCARAAATGRFLERRVMCACRRAGEAAVRCRPDCCK